MVKHFIIYFSFICFKYFITRSLHILIDILLYFSLAMASSFSNYKRFLFFTFFFKLTHRFSIWFWSELCAEYSSILILLPSKYFVASSTVYFGLLSCWNVHWHSENIFRTLCLVLLLRIPKHFGVNVSSDELRNRTKRVGSPVMLLRSLSNKYSWERYETPYSPSYVLGLNSTTNVLLEGWLWL